MRVGVGEPRQLNERPGHVPTPPRRPPPEQRFLAESLGGNVELELHVSLPMVDDVAPLNARDQEALGVFPRLGCVKHVQARVKDQKKKK